MGSQHPVPTLTAVRLAREAPSGTAQPADLWLSVPAPVLVLVGERERRLYVLKSDQIEYVESHGNYVKLHGAGVEYISRDSVKRLATALAGCGFMRIARSLLVNIRSIHYAQRASRGTYDFTLLSGSVVRSGSAFRDEILQLLPLTQTRKPAGAHAGGALEDETTSRRGSRPDRDRPLRI